ncbi:MAG: hypothetical protein D6782_08390 [Alphaproteobacteria bacterium]|nr:MAG: hypothetical protein D6782_08390 [Alphaproteobacteria bacterium]
MAIAKERIVEREDEFSFDELFPLGSTNAELLVIARAYLKACKRQRKYYPLIQEVRNMAVIAEFEQSANERMFGHLRSWVSTKRATKKMSKAALSTFTLTVFGGLLFYSSKKLQGISMPAIREAAFVKDWAAYWAGVLDGRPPQA